MALPEQITTREYQKFIDHAPGQTAVRVDGQVKPSGLNIGGLNSTVTLNAVTWTALPATPLPNRNAIAIQNESSVKVKLNFDGSAAGFVGMTIQPDGGERQYDITDGILIYGKCETGTVSVNVEEIA
jgi:hypothetical protein